MNEKIANAVWEDFQSTPCKVKATFRISKAKKVMKENKSNALYFSDGLPRFYNLVK